MKLTQREIDRMNRFDITDFYLGVFLICCAMSGKPGAFYAACLSGIITIYVWRMNGKAQERIEK